MAVAVKLDEALSHVLAEPLTRHGHDVATVHGQGWGGMKDLDLWPRVVAEGRFFVTSDLRFGDIRFFAPGTHPGILLLRPDRESLILYRLLLENVLALHSLESLKGAVIVATPRGVRIRPKPESSHD